MADFLSSKFNNIFTKYLYNLFTIIPRTLTEIVEQKGASKKRYVFYGYLCFNFLRFNFFSLLYNNEKYLKVYLKYDVVFNIFTQLNILDQLFSMFASLLFIYLIFMDNIVHGRQRKSALLLWKYAYDIIVMNRVNFYSLNFTSTTSVLRKMIEIVKTKKAVLPHQCLFLSNFSLQTRVEIIVFSYICDFLLAYLQQFGRTFGFAFTTFYFIKLLQKVSLFKVLVGLLDLLLMVVIILIDIKIASFFIAVQHIVAFSEIKNLKLKNASFLKVLKGGSVTETTSFTTAGRRLGRRLQVAYQFNAYYRQWSAVYSRSLLTNQELVSPILGVTLVANLACSVYIVAILFYRELRLWEVSALGGILSLQVLFTMVPLTCTIRLCRALFWIEKYAVLMQLQLQGEQHQHLKLKLSNFYELVNNANRFTFTVGCFGKISNKGLFEFILLYSGYLIVGFGFIQKQNSIFTDLNREY